MKKLYLSTFHHKYGTSVAILDFSPSEDELHEFWKNYDQFAEENEDEFVEIIREFTPIDIITRKRMKEICKDKGENNDST